MEKFARQKQGIYVLGAALIALWLTGCESACPPGFTKIGNRCHSAKMDELGSTASDGGADASVEDAGMKPKTTGTGTREKDAGTTRSAGGSGGQPAPERHDAGMSGTGGHGGAPAPSIDAGPDARTDEPTKPDVEPSAPDVCKGKTSGSVCDGANLHHCDNTGSTESMDSCMDAELCQIGLAANACAVCSPGAFRCDGARLDVCNNSGQFKMQELCASAALCKENAGACTDMLCQPNALTCSADRTTLNTCNADGSAFADSETCEVSEDNGCKTSTCRGSGCVPGQKQLGTACPVGKCNLSGECVACIQEADCPAVDACHTRSCDARGSCQQQTKPDGADCGGNQRCVQGKCEALPKTVALTSYWSAMRNDNFITGTAEGEADAIAAGYSRVRVEGYAFETQQPGTVPLRSFWSAMRADNFTTGTAAGAADARAAGYASVRAEGYAYETQQPGTVAFKSYWSAARNDNFTTATKAGEDDAVAAGYDFVRIEAWVLTHPNP